MLTSSTVWSQARIRHATMAINLAAQINLQRHQLFQPSQFVDPFKTQLEADVVQLEKMQVLLTTLAQFAKLDEEGFAPQMLAKQLQLQRLGHPFHTVWPGRGHDRLVDKGSNSELGVLYIGGGNLSLKCQPFELIETIQYLFVEIIRRIATTRSERHYLSEQVRSTFQQGIGGCYE